MGVEESEEIWTRVDLYCDGIGEDETTCVEYGDPNDSNVEIPMVTDCCPSAEDARRLALFEAERQGWQFHLQLQRWLCPACVRELQRRAVM